MCQSRFVEGHFNTRVINVFTSPTKDLDRRLRISAFAWLSEQVAIHGDVLVKTILAQRFIFESQRIQVFKGGAPEKNHTSPILKRMAQP